MAVHRQVDDPIGFPPRWNLNDLEQRVDFLFETARKLIELIADWRIVIESPAESLRDARGERRFR